jgi:axial budding pattern protein 2
MTGNLNETLFQGLREEDYGTSHDSFGISYGLAREGTRQLKSYIQSQISLSRTKSSIKSSESKDSRFESASGSMMSLSQFQAQAAPENQGGYDEYEDFLPDECSERSWETHHSVLDSQGNAIEYSINDLPEANLAKAEPRIRSSFIPRPLNSNPTSPEPDMRPNMRIVPGASRRPISVDGKANKRASKGKIERGDLDYTAYI